jgi:hypothetical protein
LKTAKNIFKTLFTFTLCFLILAGSLALETSQANNLQTNPNYILKIESQPSDLLLGFQQQELSQPNSNFIFNFPTQIQAQSELTAFNVMQDTRYIMDKDTELKTLIAKNSEKRFHSKLETGRLIFDTRQTTNSIQTIQVGNTFLKPFTNGLYYISKNQNQITIGSLQGSFTLGVYDSSGNLADTLLIHRYQEVSYDGFLNPDNLEIRSLSSVNFIDNFRFSKYLSIDSNVLQGELFKLTFKGKTIQANQSKSIQASLAPLNFNQNKENFLHVYPFYKKLEDAKQLIRSGNSESLTTTLVEARQIYNQTITDYPSSQTLFHETANKNLQLMSGLSPLSEYNTLKVFMADLFSSSLDSVTALKLSLSLLEDINYGYDNSKPDIAVRSEQVLRKVIQSGLPEIEVSNKINLIVVIDNILETYPQSFTQDLFMARELISQDILSQTNDQDLVNQFEARKISFFQELIDLAQQGIIDKEKAKRIGFTIIESLPEDLQAQYRQDINQIDQ